MSCAQTIRARAQQARTWNEFQTLMKNEGCKRGQLSDAWREKNRKTSPKKASPKKTATKKSPRKTKSSPKKRTRKSPTKKTSPKKIVKSCTENDARTAARQAGSYKEYRKILARQGCSRELLSKAWKERNARSPRAAVALQGVKKIRTKTPSPRKSSPKTISVSPRKPKMSDDQMYEMAKELNCSKFLKKCQTNKRFAQLCSTDQFKALFAELVEKKSGFHTQGLTEQQLKNLCDSAEKCYLLVNDYNLIVLKNDGHVVAYSNDGTMHEGPNRGFRQISPDISSPNAYLGLTKNGHVYRMNVDGTINKKYTLSRINYISSSMESGIALLTNLSGVVYYLQELEGGLDTGVIDLSDIYCTSTGKSYALYVAEDGSAYMQYIQAGVEINKEEPSKLNIGNIKETASGASHMLLLNKEGQVYVFGSNRNGQLGLGDNVARNTLTLIPGLTDINCVYAFGDTSICIDKRGAVYVFGEYYSARPTLLPMPGDNKTIQVEQGKTFLLVLTIDGKIFQRNNATGGFRELDVTVF
jgi:hypothetical protein